MVSASSMLSDWVTASPIASATESKKLLGLLHSRPVGVLEVGLLAHWGVVEQFDLVLLAETLDELMQGHVVACVDELLGLLEVGVLHDVLQIT